MTQGKYEEASRVLKRIADSNKKQLPDEYNFGVLQDDLQGEDTDRMINDSEEPHVSKPYEPIKFVDLSRVVLTSHIDQLWIQYERKSWIKLNSFEARIFSSLDEDSEFEETLFSDSIDRFQLVFQIFPRFPSKFKSLSIIHSFKAHK